MVRRRLATVKDVFRLCHRGDDLDGTISCLLPGGTMWTNMNVASVDSEHAGTTGDHHGHFTVHRVLPIGVHEVKHLAEILLLGRYIGGEDRGCRP